MRLSARLLAMVAVAALALVGVPLVSASSASASCTTYYVSSSSGSDSNSGCSTASPWLTLANVNSTTFTAGNQILFQAGGSWTGELQPQGSGASGSPIIISSYGTGAAPIIAGGGAAAAVYLHDQQYWTVENLEITNVSSTQGSRAGFLAYNDGTGILNSIHLVNNTIDNVDGYWGSSDPQPVATSAIGFETTDSNATANWNDVLIQGNTLTHDDAGGIYIGSPVGLNRNITSTNVVIQNNTITDAGGNSIVCVFCSAPLIQYNVDTDSGYRFSGAALWEGWSNNAVWQYNEVARNWRALFDGEAFDIDNNNTNTTIQYNYTHDNPWGFMEFCCSSTFGALGTSIVRDNISQNDGASNAVFSTLGGLETGATAQIYNNTVYMAPGDNGSVTNGAPPTGSSISFTNNLIYKLGTGGYSSGNMTWSHNLMYGNHPTSEPTDAAKITADPLLVNPGRAGSGLATASVYKLRSGSPALGAGAVVSGNGGLDYFGNAVSSTAAPNIGAYNGAAVAAATPTVGAYWRFDEGSGTAAYDSSGGANTGTLQAGASWTTGEMGTSAVALTGASNSYVDVPSTAIDTSGSYSVSAWVKPNSLTGNQTYASIDGTTISPFYLQLTGGQFAFTVRSADSTSSTATQALGLTPTTGTWYELTGVYDNVAHTITLYVNGVKQATTAFSSPWKATGDTEIGRAKWNGSSVDFANATIDEVRMQPKAINTQEAFALGTGATAYYELDEGSGSTFSDATGSTPAGHLESQTGWTGSGEIGSNSLSFTGTTGTFAEIPVSAVNTSQSYTVAAWVKLNSVAGTQTFAAMSGSDISPFYLQIAGGKLTFTVRSADSTSSTATSVSATASASTGTWYHVLGMYNLAAGTISLYVNGTLQGTASYTTPWQSVGATTIGAAEFGLSPVDLTNGLIDDVHFCNRTLTAAQITTLATS